VSFQHLPPTSSTTLRPALLVTIDTEGDNLWQQPEQASTRNTAFLPRFQRLCEDYGLRPTWLVNHEMACDRSFMRFGRELLRRGSAEIGMHLHAWDSPPLQPLTDAEHRHQPYLVDYTEEVMAAKVAHLSELLRDRFEGEIVSHRAGRWAMDARYARLLLQHGFRVDCSVTPGVDWSTSPGAPAGRGGSDYRRFAPHPYWMNVDAIDQAGPSGLLEVPVSIRPSVIQAQVPWAYRWRGVRRLAWRLAPPLHWMYPNSRNRRSLHRLVRQAIEERWPCLQMVLHSSDLMPGGSPWIRDAQALERLYDDLRSTLRAAMLHVEGMTLNEFRLSPWARRAPNARSSPHAPSASPHRAAWPGQEHLA
jgi:hypothetical protein